MNMKETTLKAIVTGALAALARIPTAYHSYRCTCHRYDFDYLSGMAAAWVTKNLSSHTGIIGIIKKVCYLLVVVVGMVVDYIIQTIGAQLGLDLSGYFIFGFS
jgi:hypothetical protein